MRPQKVDDYHVIEGLMSVLRSKGYDGASLNELSDAAGLKKASLYHRFPGGKEAMAEAVLTFVDEWIDTNIYNVLVDTSKTRDLRLKQAIQNIRALYDDGDAICIFRALSMETGMALFGAKISESMGKWMKAFQLLALESGLNDDMAQNLAQQTLIDVQGSLVVAKAMSNTTVFLTALDKIEQDYLTL